MVSGSDMGDKKKRIEEDKIYWSTSTRETKQTWYTSGLLQGRFVNETMVRKDLKFAFKTGTKARIICMGRLEATTLSGKGLSAQQPFGPTDDVWNCYKGSCAGFEW